VVDAAFVAAGRYRAILGVRERLYDVAAAWLILGELGAEIAFADGAPISAHGLLSGDRIERPWAAFPPGSSFRI
ncbi:MAG: hypothetical protein HYR64_03550, partial [Fimbriimonas ginsengisoli]|nr:hypothetical protein [Fimbriimonas ginsengisoli]